jgi:hypothetical protein
MSGSGERGERHALELAACEGNEVFERGEAGVKFLEPVHLGHVALAVEGHEGFLHGDEAIEDAGGAFDVVEMGWCSRGGGSGGGGSQVEVREPAVEQAVHVVQ